MDVRLVPLFVYGCVSSFRYSNACIASPSWPHIGHGQCRKDGIGTQTERSSNHRTGCRAPFSRISSLFEHKGTSARVKKLLECFPSHTISSITISYSVRLQSCCVVLQKNIVIRWLLFPGSSRARRTFWIFETVTVISKGEYLVSQTASATHRPPSVFPTMSV